MNEAEDREEYLEKNQEFHHTIYRSADRPILFEIIEDLWFRVSPYMHLYLIRGEVQGHNPYHAGMLEGMRTRSPQQVSSWLKQDLERAAEELTKQILNREE
jgi:DNA-binding GntR family transcriptional regulator